MDQSSNSDDQHQPDPEIDESEYGFEEYGIPSPFSEEYWLQLVNEGIDDEDAGDDGLPRKRSTVIYLDQFREAASRAYPEAPKSRRKNRVSDGQLDLFAGLSDDAAPLDGQPPAESARDGGNIPNGD